MSRRKASSGGTVSLFPFLAVLVCAMGALILLLLVTTRRIRQQSLVEEAIVEPVEQLKSAAKPQALPAPDLTKPVPAVATAKFPDPADQPLLPLFASDPPPKPHDPTPALLNELATLEARQVDLADEVTRRQQELAKLGAISDAQSQALEQQQATAAEHAAQKERLNNLYVRLRQQQSETEQRAQDLKQQIRQTRAQLAEADSKFAIIPYDGHSGTTRRPIVIECTADRLTFASERISLTANDLDGFPPRYNPLLYVTQALTRYWERQQRNDADIGKPYVMLVVRPGGTTGYYVARGLLAPMGEAFGYELVTDEHQFAWPDSDSEAVAICRTIIDKMLSERDAMLEVAIRSGAELGQYSNDRGEFELAEIERLKNPTREVTINGQRFSREPENYDSLLRSIVSDRAGSTSDTAGSDSGLQDRGSASPGRWSDSAASADDAGRASARGHTGQVTPRGVYTRQNAAITQQDRMTEWLREGTTRVEPPQRVDSPRRSGPSSRTSESNLFAEQTEHPTGATPPFTTQQPRPGGRDSSISADATRSDTPASSRPVPQRLDFSQRRAGQADPIDSGRPQWGPRSGNGLIGFEKQVRVEVTSTQLTIGNQSTFHVDASTSAADLRRLLTSGINHEVRTWGAPPKSFYWVPAIRFSVTADGRAQHERLKRIVKDWELQSTAEYVAE